MPSRLARIASVVLFAVLLTPAAFAQTSPGASASVRGTVTDPSGGVVAGADVRLQPVAGGRARNVASAGDGRFVFERLDPGAYLLTVSYAGLAPEVRAIDVVAAQTSNADVVLNPAGVREDVVVTATRVAAPKSSIPNTVTVLDSGTIATRTAGSDDLASLLESNVPGFAPSLKKMSGRGETLRGRNPLYSINGVPQHAPLRDGERDGHVVDLEFIERIEVIHGANAIQGIGATGGVVNMVTKSPKADGSWTNDVKLSIGNGDRLDSRGWSNKASYLVGKRQGRFDFMVGAALQKRGLFFDAEGRPVGLYPTQGDIMDSTSRGLYVKGGADFGGTRRFEASVSRFVLSRDGDYVAVPGNRAAGILSGTTAGDPRAVSGDPAENDATTVSIEYRDRNVAGGDTRIQVYGADSRALFEGGTFANFALAVGGPAFLDQSAITSRKFGAKLTWTLTERKILGITPTAGLDLAQDRSAQRLARTGRTWVPETTFREAAPFVQLQRLAWDRVLLSAGARMEFANVGVDDFTTLPSARSTFVRGGRPTFSDVLPNVGVVVPVTDRVSVYSSFAEGFTMPDVGRVLRAVNTPGLDVDSLVDIRPVVASNIEIGTDVRLGAARAHAAYYRSVSQRGALLDRDGEGVFHVRRQPTTIDGVDLSLDVDLPGAWKTGGNYAWLRGEYDSNKDGVRDTDIDGLNIAPNRLNVFLEGTPVRRLTARVQASTLFDRRFGGLAAARGRDFNGFTTADMSLGYDTRAGVLRLGVENLFNRRYIVYFSQVETAAGNDTYFAGQGRAFTLSFERRF